ncbi:hypothetical protein GCM10023211_21620 [Orbus sasakiae]|uniref:DUF2732 family protein n=1 Tax=Orbus sasakiae TaxID=1078475 RepID=A0ABP9NAT1_9GAMM
MSNNPMTSLNGFEGDALLMALNQAKTETKQGLCDVFSARLERLAGHIRINFLSPHEAAELLEQEATKMQNEKHEAHA